MILTEKIKTPKPFKAIAPLNQPLSPLDYQDELIFLLHYLLEHSLASKADRYIIGSLKKPLFQHGDSRIVDDKVVFSIHKHTGRKLLNIPPVYLKQNNPAKRIMTWLVTEFSIIYESACHQFNQNSLDKEQDFVAIISGAAHFLKKPKKKKSLKMIDEKIKDLSIFFSTIIFCSLLYFLYNLNPKGLIASHAGIAFIAIILSAVSHKKTFWKDSTKNIFRSLVVCFFFLLLYFFPKPMQVILVGTMAVPLLFVFLQSLYHLNIAFSKSWTCRYTQPFLVQYQKNWSQLKTLFWYLVLGSFACFSIVDLSYWKQAILS